MTKRQRIDSAIKGEELDRPPFSVYQHSTVHERTVEIFVRYTLNFHKTYDPDYVKVMFDENYDTPVNWQYILSREVNSTAEAVEEQGREAILRAGANKLILAPGCTFPNNTPAENMKALAKAVGAR